MKVIWCKFDNRLKSYSVLKVIVPVIFKNKQKKSYLEYSDIQDIGSMSENQYMASRIPQKIVSVHAPNTLYTLFVFSIVLGPASNRSINVLQGATTYNLVDRPQHCCWGKARLNIMQTSIQCQVGGWLLGKARQIMMNKCKPRQKSKTKSWNNNIRSRRFNTSTLKQCIFYWKLIKIRNFKHFRSTLPITADNVILNHSPRKFGSRTFQIA